MEKLLEYYATEPVLCTQYKNEFYELVKLLKILKPVSILELGTHYGGTLYQWLKYAKESVVAVDNYHINEHYYSDWSEETQRNIFSIKGRTEDDKIVTEAAKYSPYDFVFIDADHAYTSAKSDWENYAPMANPYIDSLIAFHDILPFKNTEVDRLWEEIKPHYDHWEFIEDPEQAGCGIGVLIIPRSK